MSSAPRPSPLRDLLAALQFLTRIPVGPQPWDEGSLSRAVAWFPLVGVLVGAAGAAAGRLVYPHLGAALAALTITATTVLITGALHEDGLADAADAFGLKRNRERTLEITRDSRIGTFGAAALVLSVLGRVLLVARLDPAQFFPVLITAHVLARWSTLPLTLLPPARPAAQTGSGLAVQVAEIASFPGLLFGTVCAVAISAAALSLQALPGWIATLAVTAASAAFYRRRLGGVTGDCFGATNQLVELAVLACAAWNLAP